MRRRIRSLGMAHAMIPRQVRRCRRASRARKSAGSTRKGARFISPIPAQECTHLPLPLPDEEVSRSGRRRWRRSSHRLHLPRWLSVLTWRFDSSRCRSSDRTRPPLQGPRMPTRLQRHRSCHSRHPPRDRIARLEYQTSSSKCQWRDRIPPPQRELAPGTRMIRQLRRSFRPRRWSKGRIVRLACPPLRSKSQSRGRRPRRFRAVAGASMIRQWHREYRPPRRFRVPSSVSACQPSPPSHPSPDRIPPPRRDRADRS